VFGALATAVGALTAIVTFLRANATTAPSADNDHVSQDSAVSSKPLLPPSEPDVSVIRQGQDAGQPADLGLAVEEASTTVEDEATEGRARRSTTGFFAMGAFLALAAIAAVIIAILNTGRPRSPEYSTLSQWCRPDGPIVLVIAGGQGNPTPALSSCMLAAVTEAAYDGAPVSLVNVDSNPYPAVTVRLVGPDSSIETEIFVDRISRLVSDIRTRDPHADVLEALDVAGQAIQGDFARAGTIYIEGSGLQEVGNLDLAQPGMIQVKPSALVARLRSQVGLPPLQGDTVVLVGIGETAPPQAGLDPKQQAELRIIWSAIAKASGATVHMDFSPR
jgi:hypothetical protein